MKKLIVLALAAITTLTSSAKIQQTAQFHSIEVDAPVHLVIVPGPSYSINLMSRNEQLPHAIEWKVRDGKLYLSTRDLESLQQSDSRVTVVVTAPEDLSYNLDSDVIQTEAKTVKRHFPFFRRHR